MNKYAINVIYTDGTPTQIMTCTTLNRACVAAEAISRLPNVDYVRTADVVHFMPSADRLYEDGEMVEGPYLESWEKSFDHDCATCKWERSFDVVI